MISSAPVPMTTIVREVKIVAKIVANNPGEINNHDEANYESSRHQLLQHLNLDVICKLILNKF